MTPPPDRSTWLKLIRPALRLVDGLKDNGYGPLDFRLGGGTVLMFRFDHRISKDIDLFTSDAQALGFLTPRLNEIAIDIQDYEEQANAIKFVLADGDIDLIVAGDVTGSPGTETIVVDGRAIRMETTTEILAKKMLFRADTFKARDVLDMATALALDAWSAQAAIQATARTRPALLRRLSILEREPPASLAQDLLLTDIGARHAADMVAKLQHALVGHG